MDASLILYVVGAVIGTVLAHRNGWVDLGPAGGKPADPALPPPLVPLPSRPVLQLLEQKLEQLVLDTLHEKLDSVVKPAQPAPPAPATK